MTTDPVRASAGRIAGVDIARGIAILGMFVAHTMPRDGDVELVVDGRSSLLFATLAGVSLGLLTGGEHPHDRSRRGRDRRMVLMRALLIFLLGVLLATLDSGVAVILDYYAFMFALLIPLVFLPRSVLAAIAAVLLVGAPLLADLAGRAQSSDDSVVGVLQDYLLTGTYPALVWLPVLLAGLIAARSGMDRRRTQLWLIGGGVTAAVLGYGAAAVLPGVTAEAHSATTAEILGSGGTALAVIGLVVLVTTGGGASHWVRTVLWPVGAAGALALTVYTVQILALAMVAHAVDSGGPDYPGWPLLVGLTLASLLGASVWRLLFGRGPLERLLSLASGPRDVGPTRPGVPPQP